MPRPPIEASGSAKYIQSYIRRCRIRPQASGILSHGVAIPTTGLEQEKPHTVVFSQAMCQGAAGRASADDDVIV